MSFAAAAFLVGLLALALPWWLHRRRVVSGRQREVGSLLLMRAAAAPERRHRTLRYRALLALRLALLAVLAVTFAQPLLDAAPGAAADGALPPPRVLVLDTSMSMAPVFEAARQRARALLGEVPAGTPVALVTAGAETRLAAPLDSDRRRLLAALDAARPAAVRLGFDGLLGRVAALTETLTPAAPEIHLISDFQASGMPAQFNALVSSVDVPVVLHDVSAPAANWHVAGIAPGDPVAVTVGSFADRARELTVSLSGPEGELARATVAVPARGQATALLGVARRQRDGAWLRAGIEAGDAIAADDVAYHAVPAVRDEALPVFAAPGAQRQAEYLTAAVGAASPAFRPAGPEARGPVAVAFDPGALAADQRRLLARHLDAGGAVLATVGPGTARAGRLPLAELPMASRDLQRAPSGVSAVDAGHPVLEGFAAWQDVTVFRHLAPEQELPALAALDDGTPLLIERRVGAGRVLALLTALDPEWSTLVAEPAFVTFVADALAYLAEDHLPGAAVAGQPLAIPAASLQIFDQHGRRRLGLGDTVGRPTVRLDEPGIYTVRTPNRQSLLAVNPAPRESDPTPAPAALLERWQQALRQVPPAAATAAGPTAPAPLALAPWLLLLLLGLAVAEPLAANLGRGGAGT